MSCAPQPFPQQLYCLKEEEREPWREERAKVFNVSTSCVELKLPKKSLKISAGLFVQGLRRGWGGLGYDWKWGTEGGGAGAFGATALRGDLGGFCALLNIPPALSAPGSLVGTLKGGTAVELC